MPVFSFPTLIHFGPGVRKDVGAHLRSQGIRRPLLVTDKGLAALPLPQELIENLGAAGREPALFSDITGNPVESAVTAGVAAGRAHGADGVIGLGGGAALDVGKAIALMATHPGTLFEYEDGRPGARRIDKQVPYWVALPTTAGTGSEVGRSAVISDEETHVKKIVFSPRLLARAVFADPELTLALPPKVTAATGMDALTHCIEAYLAKDYHPICDGIALEGLRLAARALPRCIEAPGDLQARTAMMIASMMGAIALQTRPPPPAGACATGPRQARIRRRARSGRRAPRRPGGRARPWPRARRPSASPRAAWKRTRTTRPHAPPRRWPSRSPSHATS